MWGPRSGYDQGRPLPVCARDAERASDSALDPDGRVCVDEALNVLRDAVGDAPALGDDRRVDWNPSHAAF